MLHQAVQNGAAIGAPAGPFSGPKTGNRDIYPCLYIIVLPIEQQLLIACLASRSNRTNSFFIVLYSG